MKKKIFISAFIILSVIIVVVGIINKKPILSIVVEPIGSAIKIISGDNEYTSTDTFKQKLETGIYRIEITKDGFITENREINLNSNTEIKIQLFESLGSGISSTLTPAGFNAVSSNSGFENGVIYGVDFRNGNLIKFENGKETIIYEGRVKDYDIRGNTAVLLDDQKLSEIVIINLVDLSQRKIDVSTVAPAISLGLSESGQEIYFLANFNIANKISSINSVSINGDNFKKLNETPAQSLKLLKEDILILLQDNHALDKNTLRFYKIGSNSLISTKTINTHKVSPDRNLVLLQRSNSVEVLDFTNLKSNFLNLETGSRYVWKDNNTVILLRNDNGNVYYSILTVNPLQASRFDLLLENQAIQHVFGLVGNKLYLQDYNGKVISLDININ